MVARFEVRPTVLPTDIRAGVGRDLAVGPREQSWSVVSASASRVEDANLSQFVSDCGPRQREPEQVRQRAARRRSAGHLAPMRRERRADEVANSQFRIYKGVRKLIVDPVKQEVLGLFDLAQRAVGIKAANRRARAGHLNPLSSIFFPKD